MFQHSQVFLALLALTFLTTATYGGGEGSLVYRGGKKHPHLPHHCYDDEHKLSIPVNETIYPRNLAKTCVKITCREDYVLLLKYCSKYNPSADCDISPPDYSKPYPECCTRFKCGDYVGFAI